MHPWLTAKVAQLTVTLAKKGIALKQLEGDRTPARQAHLYALGRTKPGTIVTHARPYESAHNYGLAADVKPYPDTKENWRILRSEARALGIGLIGEWDPGHLQHPKWPNIITLLKRTK